jgi:hypothetical protein
VLGQLHGFLEGVHRASGYGIPELGQGQPHQPEGQLPLPGLGPLVPEAAGEAGRQLRLGPGLDGLEDRREEGRHRQSLEAPEGQCQRLKQRGPLGYAHLEDQVDLEGSLVLDGGTSFFAGRVCPHSTPCARPLPLSGTRADRVGAQRAYVSSTLHCHLF